MEWSVVESTDAKADITGRKPGFVPGDVIGIVGAILLLLLVAGQVWIGIMTLLGADLGDVRIGKADLWINSLALIVVFGAFPFAWVWATRRHGWQGTVEYFQLRNPLLGVGWGIVVTVGLFAILMLAGLVMMLLGFEQENQALGDIAKVLDWPLVLAISISAGVSEEILFRGVLQRHTNWWIQAIVFGLLHAYQGVFAIFLTGALGLLFGYIVKRRWGLWIPIVAHFLFDFIQLSILMVYPEAA